MRQLIIKHWLKLTGIIFGGIAGFGYFYFVGCPNGTCPITSNPYISIIYGATLGYLLFDIFKKKENTSTNN